MNGVTRSALVLGIDRFLFLLMVLLSTSPRIELCPLGFIFILFPFAVLVYFWLRKSDFWGSVLFFPLAGLVRYIPGAKIGLFLIIPLLIVAAAVYLFPSQRLSRDWIRAGSLTKKVRTPGAIIIIVSCAGLIAWDRLLHPVLSRFAELIPDVTGWRLLFVGIAFVVLNSIMEESIYRGLFWDALEKLRFGVISIILIQGAIFGGIHYYGVPGGPVGVALASFYGFGLGYVRLKAGGLLAPILIHIFADTIIFGLLVITSGRF